MATLLKQNIAEGGTNGTTVTTANSGGTSGDAFDAVSIGTSNALIFTTTSPLRGSLSYQFTKASVNQNYVGWTWTGAQTDFGVNIRFRFPSVNLTASEPILRLYSGAGYTPQVASVNLQSGTGRKINVVDTVSAASVDSTASLALGGDYLAAVRWISGTSLTVTVYTAGTNNVVATATVASTAAAVNSLRFGLTGSSNSAVDWVVDDIQAAYGGLPTRLDIVNSSPTVIAGNNQDVAAGATVNLSATASDPEGPIASYAWEWAYHPTTANIGTATGITAASTATPSFVAGPVGSLYILKCTVSDPPGLTAFDNVEVRVPRPGSSTSRPLPLTGTGNTWTAVGGAPTDVGALADESDATYLESGTLTSTTTARKVRLDPSSPRATGTVKVKLWTDAGTATCTIRLIEGTITRQTWTQAITTAITEYTYTLSATSIAAIGDWGGLYLEVGVVSP